MRRRATAVVIAGVSVMGLVIAFSSSGASGASSAGSLDPSFGNGGKVTSRTARALADRRAVFSHTAGQIDPNGQ
jgi:hypothetical protein